MPRILLLTCCLLACLPLQAGDHTLLRAARISLDTETTSTNPRRAELVGYSFAWKEGEAYYVPVQAPAGEVPLDAGSVRDLLRPILEDPEIEKVGQNLKYDVIVLRGQGIQLQGALFDTMLADYLLDPGERNHSVDDLAKRYLNHTTIKIHELIGTGKKQKRMNQVPVDLVTPYAGEDADVPLRLYPILAKRLDTERLTPLFSDLEVPLARVLAEMEYHGIRVDVPRLREMGVELSIDDFGTGHSSLTYLKKLPVDEIKIDRSFVAHMRTSENDAVIVRSTIDLGRSLGLRVVAEGVEDEDTWRELTALGCDIGQGYYLSRPVPAPALLDWLRAGRMPVGGNGATRSA
jgi:hypothetical protein